jgi:hypothetical protein
MLMSSVCKEMSFQREVGAGGKGRERGTEAVDFKQGTSEDGNLLL